MAAIAMLLGMILFAPVLILAAIAMGVDEDRITFPALVGALMLTALVCGLVATCLVLMYA